MVRLVQINSRSATSRKNRAAQDEAFFVVSEDTLYRCRLTGSACLFQYFNFHGGYQKGKKMVMSNC